MREAPLGELLELERDEVRLEDDETYVTAGILSYGRGLFVRPAVLGSETRYKSYFRLHAGQLVYSKLFAWEGALGVVTEPFDGLFVSQEFPTLSIDRRKAEPSFIRLLCEWPPVWERVRAGETGIGGRRKRVHPDHLLKVFVPLPSLAEQRWIVDLVGAIDRDVAAAQRVARRVDSALRAAVIRGVEASTGQRRRVSDLLEHVIGGAWGDAAGVEAVDVRALGLMVFQGDPIEIDPERSSERSLSASRAARRQLQTDDIVIERSGGTDDQPVGRVVRAGPDAVGAVPTDFMRLLRVDRQAAEPRYIFWLLWAWYALGRTRAFQSHSTNIRNLRIPEYLDSWMMLPSRAEQTRLVALADTFWRARARIRAEIEALGTLRTALLSDLLSGEHEIPESYDRFLEPA